VVLEGAQYLTAFSVEQLQALVVASSRLTEHGLYISIAFLGLHAIVARRAS
jgi:hypothetical protein